MLNRGSRIDRLIVAAATSVIMVGGCSLFTDPSGQDGESGADPKGPFSQWQTTTVFQNRGSYNLAGTQQNVLAGQVAGRDTTIGGAVYNRFTAVVGAVAGQKLDTSKANTTSIWATRLSDGSMKVAGGQDNGFVSSVIPLIPGLAGATVVLDSPFTARTRPALNVQQTATVTGKLLGPSNPTVAKNVNVDVKYTRDQENVTVNTAMGPVAGCSHFTVAATPRGDLVSGLLNILGVEMTGEAWYHETFGVVAYKCPTLGLDAGLSAESDYGTAASGPNTIRKVAVLDANNPVFELNTYDRISQFDADKNSHAKMLLEFRWASDSLAKVGDAPLYMGAVTKFTTVWGEFLNNSYGWTGTAALQASPISLFHPEENGKGYRYWYLFVDQAAKNESVNGIQYCINVTRGSFGPPPLRCSARIMYTILPVGAY